MSPRGKSSGTTSKGKNEEDEMDLEKIKNAIVTNVYHIPAERKVPLHSHADHDEIFYCIKGEGFGVLENGEVELTIGKAFIVPAGVKHSMRSDDEIYVTSFLVPVVKKD
jgi:quercetin dioxygenase-like cupin family protein